MIINILTAFSVVALIGLIAGGLLAVASHLLYVKEDETVKHIRECLPGVNCGVCGYAGCDDYANAIASGKAKTNLCVPGADQAAAKISKIVGVEFEDVAEAVAYVRCNGNCNATKKRAVYEGVNSCSAAAMIYGGPNACRFGCVGCGDCASVCPSNAICINDGIAYINSSVCIGCGICASVCPKNIIELIPKASKVAVTCNSLDKGAVARKICKNACIGCKKCELNCPEKAITVKENLAYIDYSKCTVCGLCAQNCPTHCIATTNMNVV